MPSLRACKRCIENGWLCSKRVILALVADCEEGNKKAFESIIAAVKDGAIDDRLKLLSVLPDAVHVGKSIKASFSNWWLMLGKER